MTPLVIKLGGVILDNPNAITNLFTAIQQYKQHHSRPIILLHGGGCKVDEMMHKLSLPVVRRNGLRVTPAEQIQVIVGVLAGSANKTLLAEAIKQHLPAVGLCLADGDTIQVQEIDATLGHVGKAKPGNPLFIQKLLKDGYLPIISSIGITNQGQMMNVNADHAAVALAQTLEADLLILSDVAGVLDANKQLIKHLTEPMAQQLIEQGVITDGMAVKVNSAFSAAKALKRPVDIASWRRVATLITLFEGKAEGTRIMV
jgi:acetylglutamate kinase